MALSGSISGNYRNYTITTTWSATQNVNNNYSYITCHHTLYCPYGLYIGARSNSCTVNGTTSGFTSPAISTNGGTTHDLGTTYYTVYHNNDGTKSCNISTNFKLQATMSGKYVEEINASGTITLDTIPRKANIKSAPDFTDEQSPTITYENLAGNSVTSLKACISLDGSADDIAYRDISKTGTSYTFNLTENERNVLRNATKNSNTRTVNFYVQTELGGNIFRSSLPKTLTIVNATPTFSGANVTYEDTDTSVVAITKNNQHIVQNKSNLKVNYTSAIAKKGATISNYSFSLNGVTQGITSSSGSVIFGKINSSNNLTLTATVTDSRGNKTSVNKTIIILPYSKPNAIVILNRLNNYEDESYLTVDGSVASVNSKNTMAIKYRYKQSGGTYNSFTTISDNVKQTLILNKNNEYIFNVVVTDAFNEKFDNDFALGKGVFPLFIDTEKNSVGINCLPTKTKSLEIKDKVIINDKLLIDLIYPVGSVYISTNNVSPQTFFGGTWEAFATGRTLVGIDTSQTDFNPVGKTGGAKTHTLTVAQMPSHEGHMYDNFNDTGWVDRGGDTNSYYLNVTGSAGYGKYENRPYKVVSGNELVMQGYSKGEGQAHNNLQPYVVVFMWKRVS